MNKGTYREHHKTMLGYQCVGMDYPRVSMGSVKITAHGENYHGGFFMGDCPAKTGQKNRSGMNRTGATTLAAPCFQLFTLGRARLNRDFQGIGTVVPTQAIQGRATEVEVT